ncbi:MAG: hypothetical protein A2Z40_05725 [Deltaproteobacteria bacterium RBG_19FT_COMBO_60_16]|nr:MAG: hypothetical protein A2Z40_05725 [Deltaproteobacteria bacterium RBG_19FT_COMBO_60_16]
MASVADQLDGVQRGHLDAGKVRATLVFDLLLPDATVADLFNRIGRNGAAPKMRYAKPKILPWTGTPEQYREIMAAWGPM